LRGLKLDLASADGANQATLEFVRYAANGDAFTYAETGPDKFHKRIWWCYRQEYCGMLDAETGSGIAGAPQNNQLQRTRPAQAMEPRR
jgi:hypothetical protein